MKRIAVFCDGTWNSADQRHRTNVAQLALWVPPAGDDGTPQVTLYYEGVGVPQGGGALKRLDEKISGGAMGFGLDDKIAEAYRALARNYRPGDEVHVFGFSRGAYTARSLVGLIRNCGLPPDPDPALIEACLARYRSRNSEDEPDSTDSLEFRLRHSPGITTSDTERRFRQAMGAPAPAFTIAYLGVWDTVGALGIPAHWGLPAHWLNGKYRFHDTALSSMVGAARHAVAIDERRRNFVPTLWDNVAELRRANPGGTYHQQWFAGVHGAVGGGGDITALSSIALAWIAEGAAKAGLSLDRAALAGLQAQADLLGPLSNVSSQPSVVGRLLALSQTDRQGPAEIADLAAPAITRYRASQMPPAWGGRPYRPAPLRALEGQIMGVDLAALPDYSRAFG